MMLLSYENILKRLMRSEGPLLYICENKSSHALNPWRKITRLSRDIFQKNKIRVDFTPSNPFWFMWLSEVLFLHLFLRHQIFGRKKNAVYLAWQSALTIAPNEYIASAISNHRHPILFRNRYRNNLQRVCCNFLNNGKLDNSCFQTRKTIRERIYIAWLLVLCRISDCKVWGDPGDAAVVRLCYEGWLFSCVLVWIPLKPKEIRLEGFRENYNNHASPTR